MIFIISCSFELHINQLLLSHSVTKRRMERTKRFKAVHEPKDATLIAAFNARNCFEMSHFCPLSL